MNASLRSDEFFRSISTKEWNSAIDAALPRGEDVKSLFREREPGVITHPFYRSECIGNTPHPPIISDPDWTICDCMVGPVIDRGDGSIPLAPGTDCLEWRSPAIDRRSVESILEIPCPVRITFSSTNEVLALLESDIWPELNRSGVSLLVDPIGAPDGSIQEAERLREAAINRTGSDSGSPDGWNETGTTVADVARVREHGGTLIDGLAYGLAAYSAWLYRTPLGSNREGNSFTILCTVGQSLYTEIAGLRALRLLLPQISDAYGIHGGCPHLHVRTSSRALSNVEVHTNLVRTTLQAAAAVLGGADSLVVQPYDQADTGPPSLSSRILAVNIQHLLKLESAFHRVVDPLAGAYAIEVLTDTIAYKAWKCFLEIEDTGGLEEYVQSCGMRAILEVNRKRHVSTDNRGKA